MCDYCEKGKYIKISSSNMVQCICYENCVPYLLVKFSNDGSNFMKTSIRYCPWCSRDLIKD